MAYSSEQHWGEGLVEAERVDESDSGTELLVKPDPPGARGRLNARRALKAGIAGLFLAAGAFAYVTFNTGVAPSRGVVAAPDFDLDENPQKLFSLSPNGTYGPKKLKLQDFLKDKCTSLDYEFFGWYCYIPCRNLTGGKYPIRSSPATCCQEEPCGMTNSLLDSKYNARVHLYKCKAGEEKYGGKCFKRCDELTNHEYPYRVAAATCCKTKGARCFWPSNIKTDANFNIAGRNDTCKPDEELHLKSCYKKCSILTNNTYPYRSAAATCCKTQGFACISPFNTDTDTKYTVGGGSNGTCKAGWEMLSRFCFKSCASLTNGEFPNRVHPSGCCSTTGLQCLLPKKMSTNKKYAAGAYFLKGGGEMAKGAMPDNMDLISSEDKDTAASGLQTGATGPMDRFR